MSRARTDCGMPRSEKAIDCTRCGCADENHEPDGACRIRGCFCKRFTTKPCRWVSGQGAMLESPPHVEAFLDEIEAVYRKHGMAISHEDGHGAFEIVRLEKFDIAWLRAAHLDMEVP